MPLAVLIPVVILLATYLLAAIYSRIAFPEYHQDGTNLHVDSLTGQHNITGFWNWVSDGFPGFFGGLKIALQGFFPWILILLLLFFLNELRKK